MTQPQDLQTQLSQLIIAMSNPIQRAQNIQSIPQPIQHIFTDPNKRFEAIGQDGTQALVDWQNHLLAGQPMPESSIKVLESLREKLMGMVNAGTAIAVQ